MKMDDFKIEYLADRPDCLQACAAWAYGRWGVQKKDGSLERAISIFEGGMQKDTIPLTLVAINLATDLPVAMGSLWIKDGTEWPEKTPWIASVYTLYRYRGLGLAKQIIKRLEAEAINIGFQKVYLQSGSAANFYRNLGYEEIETIKTNVTASGTETLFIKKFNTRE